MRILLSSLLNRVFFCFCHLCHSNRNNITHSLISQVKHSKINIRIQRKLNSRFALEHRYIENTHGSTKYECVKVVSGSDPLTISGSHYTSENAYFGTVSYVLESSDSQLTSNRPSGCLQMRITTYITTIKMLLENTSRY